MYINLTCISTAVFKIMRHLLGSGAYLKIFERTAALIPKRRFFWKRPIRPFAVLLFLDFLTVNKDRKNDSNTTCICCVCLKTEMKVL